MFTESSPVHAKANRLDGGIPAGMRPRRGRPVRSGPRSGFRIACVSRRCPRLTFNSPFNFLPRLQLLGDVVEAERNSVGFFAGSIRGKEQEPVGNMV